MGASDKVEDSYGRNKQTLALSKTALLEAESNDINCGTVD